MSLFEEAVKHFGEEKQKRHAIQEMSELIQAITKEMDGEEHNVPEEIADVYIMLAQLEVIYGETEVYMKYIKKLDKLQDRIKCGL